MIVVWQLAAATLGGALLGAGAVYGWVRAAARRVPVLLVRHRKVDPAEFARLTEAFGSRIRQPARFVAEHDPSPDLDVLRYTYVQGPIRNRDTDQP